MATSFFGDYTPGAEAARLGKSLITLPGGDNLVCAAAAFQFQRQVGAVSPLNLKKRVITAGEPVGQITLGVLIGPSKGVGSFLRQYADECKLSGSGNNIMITPVDDCGAGTGRTRWLFSGLLLSGISGNVARTEAGNLVIPSVQLYFVDFEYDD